jgi:predicted enzyme related to lactoylglutathione lyase
MPRHPVVHLELHTSDAAAAEALYADVCGWRPEHLPTAAGAYRSLEVGPGLGGGIVECAARRPVWLPYVEVPDVTAATERAVALGARVLLAPRDGPVGRRSVVATVAGGEIAFWQPRR